MIDDPTTAIWVRLGGNVDPSALAVLAVLELHTRCECSDDCPDCNACSGPHHADPQYWPCDTVKAIAGIFDGRPAATLDWHYGPTKDDPDSGKMWHRDCGGEVWYLDDGTFVQNVVRNKITLATRGRRNL